MRNRVVLQVYFFGRVRRPITMLLLKSSVSSAQLGSVNEDSHDSASMFLWTRKNVAVFISITAAILLCHAPLARRESLINPCA